MGRLQDAWKALTQSGSGSSGTTKPTGYETAGYGYLGDGTWSKSSEYLEEMRGWVFACVNAIADEVGSVQLKLFRQGKSGIEEVVQHEILDALYKVNNYTTKFDHFWLTAAYLELTGEAPWFLDRSGRSINGIYFLRPDRIEPIPDKQNVIRGYRYNLGTERIELGIEEVIFLKYPNPANPFRGMGTLQASAMTVDIDNYAERWNKKFYENSARPDAILKVNVDTLSEEQKEKLKASVRKLYQGVDKSHNLMVLFGDMEFEKFSSSQKEMDFLEQSKFTRDKIMGMFRVPKAILAQTEDVNFASAKVAQYVFARWTIKPKLERLVQQLNEFFVPMFPNSENLFLDYESPVPEDDDAKVTRINTGVYKWLTVNEARAVQGLDAVPNGDILYLPNGYTPLVDTVTGETFETTPEMPVDTGGAGNNEEPLPESQQQGKQLLRAKARQKLLQMDMNEEHKERIREMHARSKSYFEAEELRKQLTEKVKKEIRKQLVLGEQMEAHKAWKKTMESAKYRQLDDAGKKDFYNVKDKVFENYWPLIRGRMQRVFEAQRSEVLAKYDEQTGQKAVDPKQLLLDRKEQEKLLEIEVLPILKDLFQRAGDESLSFLGISAGIDMTLKRVVQLLKADNRLLATGTTKATNEAIKLALAEGIKNEETTLEIRERIQGVFNEASDSRAQLIARTEANRFNVNATEEAFKQSGVVEAKEWIVQPDADEVCQPFAGKIVKLGEVYVDKGETLPNGVVNNYAAVLGPPLHPNCRCDLAPVFTDN